MAGNFLLIVCVQSWCIITTRQLIFLWFFIFMIECANPPSLTLQLLIKCKTFVRCNINDRDAQNYLLSARFCLDDWCLCTSIYCFPIFIHFSVKKINDNNNNVYKKITFTCGWIVFVFLPYTYMSAIKRMRTKSFEMERKYSLAVEYTGIFKILLWKALLKTFVVLWSSKWWLNHERKIANVGKTNFSFKISNILVFIIRVSEATIVFV